MRSFIRYHSKCWTGRKWLTIGPLHLGFGPRYIVERIMWNERLVGANRKAERIALRIFGALLVLGVTLYFAALNFFN